MEAQLQYYHGWFPAQIRKMSESDIAEAWQNLVWVRSEEKRLQDETNNTD